MSRLDKLFPKLKQLETIKVLRGKKTKIRSNHKSSKKIRSKIACLKQPEDSLKKTKKLKDKIIRMIMKKKSLKNQKRFKIRRNNRKLQFYLQELSR